MTRPYDSDGDGAAEALAAHYDAKLATEARTLSGAEVMRLRAAVEAAAKALRQLNTKGLPYQHRRDIEAARTAIEDARPLVARKSAASGLAPERPDETAAVRAGG